MADMFVPVRAGADIAFVGGLVNYVLTHEKYFHEYVLNYTNASVILSEDFADTEDLDGVFSGLDREHRCYDPDAWRYEGFEPRAASGARGVEWRPTNAGSTRRPAASRTGPAARPPTTTPETDETLQHPRCVFQVLKRHFARYTPEMVARIAGVPEDAFPRSASWSPRTPGAKRPRRSSTASAGPSTRSASSTSARRDPAGAARQHGPAGRRDPGAARARVHPGVHRHPDAVRPAARLPAHAVRHHRRRTWTATCRPRRW